ncbi:ABC transporter permease [Thermodesulfobacteriota bacterium]
MMQPTKIITPLPPSALQYLDPAAMFRNLYTYRELITQFAWREAVGRYKGTYLGLIWSVFNPLLTLAVYSFVFGIIVRSRFGHSSGGSVPEFVLALFSGIVIYNVFAVCSSKAPVVVASRPNLVKKVVFPLEILPVAALGSSLIAFGFSLVILMPCLFIFSPSISGTMYMFPLVLIPLCALSLGVGWLVGSIGVFIRDMGQVIPVLMQLLFFLSPVIYPISAVPESLQWVMRLNPLATILEDTRRTLVWGQPIEWGWWLAVTVVSLIIMQLGYLWYMRMKRVFADVV